MNIQQLQMIAVIAKQGSISKAALAMHMSQSALSQQLQGLENELNGQIFSRTNKGVQLTCFGELVYTHSIKISQAYETMLEEFENFSLNNNFVKILATPIVYSYALPCALFQIQDTNKNYKLKIEEMHSNEIEDKIAGGCAEIGVIAGPPQKQYVEGSLLFKDEIHLVVNAQLDTPDNIKLEDIKEYPMIMLDLKNKTAQQLSKSFLAKDIEIEMLNIIYYLDSFESIKTSVINGYSFAFLPYSAIKKELYNNQLKSIKIEDLYLSIDYYTITHNLGNKQDARRNKVLQNITNSLVDYIC